MARESATCYMCDNAATSREHVPPRCFFPEMNDLQPGQDYRQNLITVPSCEEHNLSKSKDDEYLRFVVSSHWTGNQEARLQFSDKVLTSIRRRPSLKDTFMRESMPSRVGTTETGAFVLDQRRFHRSVVSMAKALYFHHFHREKWTGDLGIESRDLVALQGTDVEARNRSLEALDTLTEKLLSQKPWVGENPAVFCYQIHRDLGTGHWLVRMRFYEGFTVMAHWLPMGS